MMTIGTGRRVICCRTNATPSISGMFKSHVMTSGLQLERQFERSVPIARGPHHLDKGAARQHLRHHLAHIGRVVHDEDADDRGDTPWRRLARSLMA